MKNQLDRREFLGTISTLAAAGPMMFSSCNPEKSDKLATYNKEFTPVAAKPIENVRIGLVGVGGRGSGLARQLLSVPGCQIVCVCDLIRERVEKIQKWVVDQGLPEPIGYYKNDVDYKRMCEKEDFDLLITATPWKLHAPVCVSAMENGKHAATEVPGCQNVDESWEMVEASEKYNKHCILLENYCYFREIMAVDRMIRAGLFGNPIHIYAGYQKEAMFYMVEPDGSLSFAGDTRKNSYGNVYPTHHGGPSARWINLNRGDAFDYLVSMGTSNVAYNLYGKERFGPDHPLATTKYDMTEISNTLIMTKEKRVIHLLMDVHLPRPHRHYFRLQAERGIYEHIERRLHIHGLSPGRYTGLPDYDPVKDQRQWESIEKYYDTYDHPLWKEFYETTRRSGHGGADWIMLYTLIKGFNKGVYPDIDVYDLAAWSCLIEVTEHSARNRSKPVDVPDFTRGAWKYREPLPIAGLIV